jgi:hypothetical protein
MQAGAHRPEATRGVIWRTPSAVPEPPTPGEKPFDYAAGCGSLGAIGYDRDRSEAGSICRRCANLCATGPGEESASAPPTRQGLARASPDLLATSPSALFTIGSRRGEGQRLRRDGCDQSFSPSSRRSVHWSHTRLPADRLPPNSPTHRESKRFAGNMPQRYRECPPTRCSIYAWPSGTAGKFRAHTGIGARCPNR